MILPDAGDLLLCRVLRSRSGTTATLRPDIQFVVILLFTNLQERIVPFGRWIFWSCCRFLGNLPTREQQHSWMHS
ncbi:MAG: hypothetical protein WB239_17205, partial [Acidimicrobiia bacterium]